MGERPFDCSSVSDVPTNECSALVDFYHATNGSGWAITGGWLANTGVCNWSGITCSIDHHVSWVFLWSNSISGAIPASFGNLTGLSNFGVEHNNITSLPSTISNLRNLLVLDVSDNKISSIPPEIGSLPGLRILSLVSNTISSLPSEIGNITGLQSLAVNHNQLTSLPASFANLT